MTGGGVPPGGAPGGPFAGTEFGELLQHAVQIKGQQSIEKRKRFEQLPQFTQHSLFFGGMILLLFANKKII